MTDIPSSDPVPATAPYAPAVDVQMVEGATYDAHLTNLAALCALARNEYAAVELAVESALATCVRAENDLAAAWRMTVTVAWHDFGAEHVAKMRALCDLLETQVAQARASRRASREALTAIAAVSEVCTAAEAAFRRDHGRLAEAHAAASNPAKTREAYQR